MIKDTDLKIVTRKDTLPNIVKRAFEAGEGIFRLAPNWVPRSFCIPGRRIKLHPDDYLALGGERGGIDERWFSSTIKADNGPLTGKYEGLSFIVVEEEGKMVLLRDAVQVLQGELIGQGLWDLHKEWPMYSKFFDNQEPLPHHIHQRTLHVSWAGMIGKPEAYYFPPQANNHEGDRASTFFGFQPHITKDQVCECLINFAKGDNHILDISVDYKLNPGTGWDVPAGVLHAPGSFCTYEPQVRSDVFSMWQSYVGNRRVVPEELLWKNSPPEVVKAKNVDYLIELMDWDLNIDPNFAKNRFMEPRVARETNQYIEKWVCYKSDAFSAKELTVLPGQTVIIQDNAAYGFIMMQGNGIMNELFEISTPSLIRYGQLTHDEYFVSERAAKKGITITNLSDSDPIVMLKHFGPSNPDLPIEYLDQRLQRK